VARYNEILVGRFNRRLQKFFSMKGEPPAPQLASEVQPGIQLFVGVEEFYLEGIDRFGRVVQDSVVGQGSAIRLRNPSGSNVAIALEFLTYQMAGNTTVNVFIGNSALDENSIVTPGGNQFDNRGRPNSAGIVSFNTGAPASTAGLGTIYGDPASGTTRHDLINTEGQMIPILPGGCLLVQSGAAATSLSLSIWWRERHLEESERF